MTERGLALDEDDPVGAADMIVAIVAAGRAHLDAKAAGAIEQRLRARYGLASLETLRE
jgi:hypothetical protein